MPLWKIYHTANAFSAEDKAEVAKRITTIVYPHLPAFYVGVAFQELSPENFYVAGEPATSFVRIWIDHIARTLPTPAHKADWLGRAHKAILPIFTKNGFHWEFHVDETPRDLWSIQGFVPPQPNTETEQRWRSENKPSPYEVEATSTV